MTPTTLSVIIPAFNEAGNLAAAVAAVQAALAGRGADYELLIFDDGSTDGTGAVADKLAGTDPQLRVIHNGRNCGFGYNYCRGVDLAQMEYVALVPGDNEIDGDSLAAIFARVGEADVIAPYAVNACIRPLSRRIISRAYTTMLNLLFGLNLQYYNGPAVHRTEWVKQVPITTAGFAFLSEIMVRTVRSGHTYLEVGMVLRPRAYGRSKALSLKNGIMVASTILRLVWSVYVQERAYYAFSGRRVV